MKGDDCTIAADPTAFTATPPSVTAVTYVPTISGTMTISWAEWTKPGGCSNTYALTVPTTPKDLTGAGIVVSTNVATGKSFTLTTTDAALKGAYTFTVKILTAEPATYTGAQLDISVTIVDPCEPTHGPTTTATANPTAVTYNLFSAKSSTDIANFTFVPSACVMTYLGAIGSCNAGACAITATKDALNFSIESSTPAHAGGPFSLTIQAVSPLGVTIATPKTTLTVTIVDPCETNPVVVVGATPIASTAYTLGDGSVDIIGAVFMSTPSDCVVTYGATIPGTVNAASLTFVAGDRKFVLNTILPADAGTHTVIMFAKTPTGGTTIASPQKSFNIVITDPCEPSTSITVGATPTAATYRTGDAAVTMQWAVFVSDPVSCLITYAATFDATITTALTFDYSNA